MEAGSSASLPDIVTRTDSRRKSTVLRSQIEELKQEALYGSQVVKFRSFLFLRSAQYQQSETWVYRSYFIITFEFELLFLGMILLFDSATKLAIRTLEEETKPATSSADTSATTEEDKQEMHLRVLTFIEATYEST